MSDACLLLTAQNFPRPDAAHINLTLGVSNIPVVEITIGGGTVISFPEDLEVVAVIVDGKTCLTETVLRALFPSATIIFIGQEANEPPVTDFIYVTTADEAIERATQEMKARRNVVEHRVVMGLKPDNTNE